MPINRNYKLLGLPPLDRVFVHQAQFFDNTDQPRKQGHSDYSVKLFLWCGEFGFDWRRPDWHRVIQLIEPARVLQWAEKKHASGDLSDEELSRYQTIVAFAEGRAQENPAAIIRLGHISSPPGKHYFPGQLIFFDFDPATSEGACVVFREGDSRDLGAFKLAKKAQKARAAKGQFLLDPCGVIERQKAEDKKLRDRRMFGGAPV